MNGRTVDRFIENIERSCLIGKEELGQALASIKRSEPAAFDERELLALRFIQDGLLTRWQCDNLLQGKYKSFFLGPYRLLRLLGRGGLGDVYLAEHTTLGSLRAVKVLGPARSHDHTVLACFQGSARAFCQLNHPNIVQVFDIGQAGRAYFMVQEYIEGRDLHAIVSDDGPLACAAAADYVRQAANGLDYAHQKGVVHCRVNPSHLMLDTEGTVKVLGSFSSQFAEDQFPLLTLAIHKQTDLLAAGFLAPEDASDGYSASPPADIYCLGCTLYYLLTSQPPFPSGTLKQRAYGHVFNTPESIYKFRPDAPKELVEFCEWMMNKSPDARPQTMHDVAAALECFRP